MLCTKEHLGARVAHKKNNRLRLRNIILMKPLLDYTPLVTITHTHLIELFNHNSLWKSVTLPLSHSAGVNRPSDLE